MRIRRTLLWIPGNNPAMMANAPILRADTIGLDNEDAVQPGDKDAARILIRNYLESVRGKHPLELAVRINDVTTPYWKDDITCIAPAQPDAFIVPKVERPEDLYLVHELLTQVEKEHGLPENEIKLLPILETALGIENAFLIASTTTGRLDGIMMGGEDLVTSLGALRTREGREIDYARCRIVSAARACNLNPIDTVFPDVEDIEGMIADTKYSRQIGYSGRAVISPRHVTYANEVYSPSEKDILYAQEVLEAYEEGRRLGKGAVSLHGKMIDAPMIPRAQQVLEIAKMIRGGKL